MAVDPERPGEYSMARNLTPAVKIARREGAHTHPKAVKALTRRNYGPGQHGQSRRPKPSDYSLQLREKQKVKRFYGILEKQFRRYIGKAEKMPGVTGENLLQLLERRLDNVIYRLGVAPSRPAARQIVSHGHVLLNGKRVDIPSIMVSPSDEITIRDASLKTTYFVALKDSIDPNQTLPSWLSFEPKKLSAKVIGMPLREEQDQEIQEQLIIEYYSR